MQKQSRPVKRILVATDFSENSRVAILKGIEFAKKNKGEVIILHVAKKGFFEKMLANAIPLIGKVLITPEEYAASLLEKMTQQYSKDEIKIKHVILSGDQPARKILKYGKDHKSDLLIIGAHGKYSIHDWFVGTTAEYIARKTPIPVLIIKRIKRKSYQRILVPLDFSNASKSALLFAYKLFSNSKLKLLHIGDHEFEELLKKENKISKDKVKTMRKSVLLLLSEKMRDFIKKCNNKLSKLSFEIKFGYPGIGIIEEAKKLNQDLVIMGTEGHSQRHYLFMGRTASRVLIEIDRDLLLIPPHKK